MKALLKPLTPLVLLAGMGLASTAVSVHPPTPAMARGPILGADGLWRFASIPRGNGRAGGRCR